MPTSCLRIAIVATLAVAFASGAATAKTSKADRLRQQAQQVCFADAQKLCSDVLADEAKTTACMKDNKSKLSPPCLKVFDSSFGRQ